MSQGLDDGLRIVLTIARALRDEFGVGIDAHPGGEGIEAGAVNSAFLAAATTIVAEVVTEGDDPATVVTHVLRQAALRWLAELGVRPEQAEVLVRYEPRLGDRWLAYLALAPGAVIDDLTSGPLSSSSASHEPSQPSAEPPTIHLTSTIQTFAIR
jgi:hypothetical protein